MKRIVLLTILMVVCAGGMFAQTEEVGDSVASSRPHLGTRELLPKYEEMSKEDMAKLWKTFQQYAMESQKDDTPIVTTVPVSGNSKFTRRHDISQRLEISIIGGGDGSNDDANGTTSMYDTADEADDAVRGGSNFSYGLNVGYSLVMVPGHINGDSLVLNKLGLGYSLGLIASFDRQEYFGTTCDFLAKLGIEAGNGHKMGIGFDLLVGSGKSAGEYSFDVKDDNGTIGEAQIPYTAWCFKYGAQLWVRSKLLNVSIKDTDVRLFARYVYSKNPESEAELLRNGIFCDWKEESWTFGLTFCYTF